MKQATALRLLAAAMEWDNERAREEFAFLHLMAALKYDDYRDFLAGMRFLESLAAWLQQFDPGDRDTAYAFVRERLVYISAAERERLVALLYPREIYPRLLKAAARECNSQPWFVLASDASRTALVRQRRSTLFLALSDGARLDSFRHLNPDLSNEQIAVGVQLGPDKWTGLRDELREDLKDEQARFQRVVLVDDFTASGTSFIRKEGSSWKGKLSRFYASLGSHAMELLAPNYDLIVHHHLGTAKASAHLNALVPKYLAENAEILAVAPGAHFVTFGHCYDEQIVVTDADFLDLARRHFDKSLITKHTSKGGSDRLWLGYAECHLPVVLDHNTPNNSFPLLWAQTIGVDGAAMRPLFRRRQRHS